MLLPLVMPYMANLTYWPVVQRMLLHLKIVKKCSIYICSHPHRTQYARRLRVMTRVKKFERLDFGIRGYLEQRHHWSQLLLKRHRHYQPQQQSTRLLLSQIFCIIHHAVGQSSHWSNFFDEIYKLLQTSAAQKYCIYCKNKKYFHITSGKEERPQTREEVKAANF